MIALVIAAALGIGARTAIDRAAEAFIYDKAARLPHCRVALVLGCKVNSNGSPCTPLKDRLDKAIELYRGGKVEKLLMPGDDRFTHYNEPQRMRDYAVAHGIPDRDIAMDFAGRRTYDSMYRARHIWGLSRLTIVTQRFHLPRSVFLAHHLGINAYGIPADRPNHTNPRVIAREYFACLGAIYDTYLHKPRPVMGKRERI